MNERRTSDGSDVDGARRAGPVTGLDLRLDLHGISPEGIGWVGITPRTSDGSDVRGGAAGAAAGLDLGLDLHGQSPSSGGGFSGAKRLMT